MEIPSFATHPVSVKARQPLVDFMADGLAEAGCHLVHASPADRAPFVLIADTPQNERVGIVAYAFRAKRTPTHNRPSDERSFQIKYGSKKPLSQENIHEIWQDPRGAFTTLLIGIDPDEGFCVSADPVLHSPTRFFIRVEFKDAHAEQVRAHGWHAWQRSKSRAPIDGLRVETLVGAERSRFLDLVLFERAARSLDPGNRLIVAEAFARLPRSPSRPSTAPDDREIQTHPLAEHLGLPTSVILDVISSAPRLGMAVRGFVAEEHLRRGLSALKHVTSCIALTGEGDADLAVSLDQRPALTVECKNVARVPDRDGLAKIDFQRTRASKSDPCSRYYKPTDFDVIAACLHPITAKWDFMFILPERLAEHRRCPGRLASNVRVDKRWSEDAEAVLSAAYDAKERLR